jgi:hypothetical protein
MLHFWERYAVFFDFQLSAISPDGAMQTHQDHHGALYGARANSDLGVLRQMRVLQTPSRSTQKQDCADHWLRFGVYATVAESMPRYKTASTQLHFDRGKGSKSSKTGSFAADWL